MYKRQEQDRFLDDVTVGQLEEALGVPVRTVPNDGYELLDALILACLLYTSRCV